MKIKLFDFNPNNPLGFEWACLFLKYQNDISYIFSDKLDLIRKMDNLEQLPWSDFNLERDKGELIIFLPWLPERIYFVKLIAFWLLNGLPRVLWIDHNHDTSRDKSGLILFTLRKIKSRKIIRLVHKNPKADSKVKGLVHPIFFNYVDNIVTRKNKDLNSLEHQIVFFGRISCQKGIDLMPEILSELEIRMGILEKKLAVLIIGSHNEDSAKYLEEISNTTYYFIDVKVCSTLKQIDESALVSNVSKSTLVLAPYREVTASGTISLAIALNKPVILMSQNYPHGIADESIFEYIVLAPKSISKFVDLVVKNLEFSKNLNPYQKDRIQKETVDSFFHFLPRFYN